MTVPLTIRHDLYTEIIEDEQLAALLAAHQPVNFRVVEEVWEEGGTVRRIKKAEITSD